MSDAKIEPGYQPPDLSLVGEAHVRRYLETAGAEGHQWNGAGTLILTTTGRKSAIRRQSALIYGRDGDNYLVVASKGGADTDPDWYRNLSADPHVEVQVGSDHFAAVARTAGPDEKPRLWKVMTAVWPNYDVYTGRTTRAIPLVVLERVAPAARTRSGQSVFFDMHAPPDEAMAVGDPDPNGARPDYVVPYFAGRIDTHDLLSNKETNGLRLSIIRLAPGTVLPRHSHDVDYIEFVLEGEVHHGNRRLGVGAGVYRPAGAVYTYTAGPDGATIADFRAHTYYGTQWADDPARWPAHRTWS